MTLGRYPVLNGNEGLFIWNPSNKKYYFIREGIPMEFSPDTNEATRLSDIEVTTIKISESGDILLVRPDRQVQNILL